MISKVLDFAIYPESINGDRLSTFMYDKMYDVTQAYPKDHSVIEIDNHSVHYDVRVQEIILNKGASFFPCVAYDPRHNPTEYLFGNLKVKFPGQTRNINSGAEMTGPITDCCHLLNNLWIVLNF